MAKSEKAVTKRARKSGSAARHEVNRAELDPLKARVEALEHAVSELRADVKALKGE